MDIIQGQYRGATASGVFIDLRIERVSSASANGYVLSGDVFHRKRDPDYFEASFRQVVESTLPPAGNQNWIVNIVIEGRMTFSSGWKPEYRVNGSLELTALSSTAPMLSLDAQAAVGAIKGIHSTNLERPSANSQYPDFREITWEIDSLIRDDLNASEAAGLNQSIQQVKDRVVASSLRQGIKVLDGGISENLTTSVPQWSEDDLNWLMTQRGQVWRNQLPMNWRCYGVLAPQFREGSGTKRTVGIMFDRTFRPGDQFERQGFAVFWNSIQLASGPSSLVSPNNRFNQLLEWAWIHEFGHAFNLVHLPVQQMPGNLSYMNYPQNYGDIDTYLVDLPQKHFSTSERRLMLHGHFQEVIMGGIPFREDQLDQVLAGLNSPRERPDCSFTIRFRPDSDSQMFRFGEPVFIEVKLSANEYFDHDLADDLDPVHYSTSYIIEKPTGQVVKLQPFVQRCSLTRMTADRKVYENVLVSHDSRGAIIDEPGNYRVQAQKLVGGRRLFSNILRLAVRPPSQAEEKALYDSFSVNVAKYLSFWGSAHIRLPDSLVDAVARQKQKVPVNRRGQRSPFSDHALFAELERCDLYQQNRGGIQYSGGAFVRVSKKTPISEMQEFLSVGSKGEKKSKSLSNIHFSHLAGTFVKQLSEADTKPNTVGAAEEVIEKMKSPRRAVSDEAIKRWLQRWLPNVDPKDLFSKRGNTPSKK